MSHETNRAAIAAGAWGEITDALRNAYRTRRRDLDLSTLAKETGYPSGMRVSQVFTGGTTMPLSAENVARLAALGRALGLAPDVPTHKVIPIEEMRERWEHARLMQLLPPSPRSKRDVDWERWSARCREILERERAAAK